MLALSGRSYGPPPDRYPRTDIPLSWSLTRPPSPAQWDVSRDPSRSTLSRTKRPQGWEKFRHMAKRVKGYFGRMTTDSHVRLVHVRELSDRAPYAYAAVAEGPSRWVFTAGACLLDEHGAVVGVGDVAGQTEQVIANLRCSLAAAGAELTDIVKTTVYVSTGRREDLLAAWEVVHRHFGDHEAPSTLLGVGVLGYRDQLVEVEAVAALP